MGVEQYSNLAQTVLDGAVLAGDTAIDVLSATYFPTLGVFRIVIDSEILKVTSVSGQTFTVERGAEGTTAANHASGTPVTLGLTAESMRRVLSANTYDEDVEGQGVFLAAFHEDTLVLPHLCVSIDGATNWASLTPGPIWDNGDSVRDPSIVFYGDLWYICHTGGTGSLPFRVMSSPDLQNWTLVTDVDMTGAQGVSSSPNAVWAPEWFVDPDDGSIHVYVSVGNSSINDFYIWEVHPTADDMSTWSAPVQVVITGKYNTIDPFVVKKGSTYYLWYKLRGSPTYIEYASSSNRAGPFTVVESGAWSTLSVDLHEAPALVKLSDTKWRCYINQYSGFDSIAMKYADSTDDWSTWSSLTTMDTPFLAAHGTVLRIRDLPAMRQMLGVALTGARPRGSGASIASAISYANNTATVVTFDTEVVDDLGACDLVTHATRLTAPSTGWYQMDAHAIFASTTSGREAMQIRKNGATELTGASKVPSATDGQPELHCSCARHLTQGDYIELLAIQSSGGALNLSTAELYMLRMS